MQVTVFD